MKYSYKIWLLFIVVMSNPLDFSYDNYTITTQILQKQKEINMYYHYYDILYCFANIYNLPPNNLDKKITAITINAILHYKEYNILLPAELVFAQALLETHFGEKGRNHKTNMFAIYEYDTKTMKKFNCLLTSTSAYFSLILNEYYEASFAKLLKNFVNKKNKRYASCPNYEKKIVYIIKRLEKNCLYH